MQMHARELAAAALTRAAAPCWPDRYYETWLAWANMERALRQLPAARSVFKRCYSRRFEEGGQAALAYEWLRFEREEGRCGCAAGWR